MNATAPRTPGVKMTIPVYKVDRYGTVSDHRGTVNIPCGQSHHH
ncbi:hypothetical protein [Streptomyces sp. GESEQ-4]|nr:hypothetical protein [Streptomyces sp. GESEQ-4]